MQNALPRPVAIAIASGFALLVILFGVWLLKPRFNDKQYYQDAANLQKTEGVLLPTPNGGAPIRVPVASDQAYQPER